MSIKILVGVPILASVVIGGVALARPALAPEPKTAEAVLKADWGWSADEHKGDVASIEALLEPGYQSVNSDGTADNRAEILAGAAKRTSHPDSPVKVAAQRASHPVAGDVRIFGDMAVVTWIDKRPNRNSLIKSCHIFVYKQGRWHGVYSQHTADEA